MGGGTINSKPLGLIIMMGQSETWTRSQIIFIILFFVGSCTALLCLSPSTINYETVLNQNHFPEPDWPILTSLHPIVLCTITY
jgi:hypothetical protein